MMEAFLSVTPSKSLLKYIQKNEKSEFFVPKLNGVLLFWGTENWNPAQMVYAPHVMWSSIVHPITGLSIPWIGLSFYLQLCNSFYQKLYIISAQKLNFILIREPLLDQGLTVS